MQVFWLSALTFIASFIGTLAGFGSSTIMIPIVAMFFPLPVTLLFVAIVHFFNDLWEVVLFKHKIDRKLLVSFVIPGIIASFLGAKIVLNYNQDFLSQILGMFLVGYVIFLYLDPKFKLKENILTSSLGGGLSGIVAGIFGVGGPIQGLFLSAYNLKKEVYISTLGAIAIFIDTTRIATYLLGGIRMDKLLWYSFVFLVPISFMAAKLAKTFVNKMPQENFRKIISVLLLIIGVKLIISPL
jgi:uncharacterized membrane protein YfcA